MKTARYNFYFFVILFSFIISNTLLAQDRSLVQKVLYDSAEEIFTIFHSSSSFGSSEIIFKDSNTGVKVYLKIEYKGWMKSHKMKLAIYFDEDGPSRVKYISDSNVFKSRLTKEQKANKALMVLQENWEEISD